MSMKLKIAAAMIVMCCTCLICHAQQQDHTVSFSYDEDGNRVTREILIQRMDEKGETVTAHTTTKATDFFNTATIELYPNPTGDRFVVEIKGGEANALVRARLTDMSGAVLLERTLRSPMESFDISGLASGIYFLRLTAEEETHVWKVIKK